jgi:hypothetical protein
MAVVFLEGGVSPIPMRVASRNFMVDPAVGYVNQRFVERNGLQSADRNPLQNLDF